MLQKLQEKNIAIKLRHEGFSYREILKEVRVSKSTLSLWLRGVGLSSKQKQRLTDKKIASALKGAHKKKEIRINSTNKIKKEAKKQIGKLSERELWLIGIALYWGEGSKEKDYRPGSGLQFSNSDPYMIKLFICWLLRVIKIPKEKIYFEIYIHKNHKNNINRSIAHWSNYTGFSKNIFNHIYYKKNKIKTNRKNTKNNYFGLLRIRVKNSSELNRKVAGWTEGIYGNY